jgi:hypothetical protein
LRVPRKQICVVVLTARTELHFPYQLQAESRIQDKAF